MRMLSKALLLGLLGAGLSVAAEAVDGRAPDDGGAAGAASQPPSATTRAAGREAPLARGSSSMRLPVPDFRGFRFQPTPEQVKEMEDFVGTHCPNRFKAYQNFTGYGGPFGGGHERLQRALVRGYLDLQVLSIDDPELYTLKVQQMEAQDQIFGIVADARERGVHDVDRVRAKLRPKEEELVKVKKAEAELRVQRLSDALAREKEQVATLSSVGPSFIDAAIQDEIQYGGRIGFGPPLGGGPYGGGGGPRGGPTTEPTRRGK